MKIAYRIILLCFCALVLYSSNLSAQISISATVGVPTGSYTTLKSAFDAINNGIHQGNIQISVNASTTETATATLNASGGLSGYSSITIRPTTACMISGNVAGPLIMFNGADTVTIDGRIGGVGNTRSLTIQNTFNGATPAAYTLYFVNGANKNTVQYCILEGLSQYSYANATVYSSGANLKINIDNNEIRPVGNGWQKIGISGHIDSITNNLIHDFTNQNSFGASMGISGGGGVIRGNSLYHMNPVITTGYLSYGIAYIQGGSISSKNYIGGSAPYGGGAPALFSGENFAVSGIGSGIVDSNIITNIQIVCPDTAPGSFGAIGGSVTVTNNTIGSMSDTSAITVYHGRIQGIGGVNIQNNKIGGLTAYGSGNQQYIYCISVGGSVDSATLINNEIGSAIPSNIRFVSSNGEMRGITITSKDNAKINCSNNIIRNFNATGNLWLSGIYNSSQTGDNSTRWILNNDIYQLSASNNTGDVTVNGIYSGFTSSTAARINNFIRGNTIRDIGITGGGQGSSITGIRNESLGRTFINIDSNYVYKISSAANNPTAVLSVAVQGIGFFNPNNIPVSISRNVIYNLSSTSTAATNVAGINAQYNSDTNQITIDANRIYDLRNDNSVGGAVAGMMVGGATGGTLLVKNNMISLSPNTTSVYGILNNLGASSLKVYNNSIYLRGLATGSNSSAAFSRIFYANTNTRLQNNIFLNFRSGGTGSHYSIMNANTNPGTGWIYSNYNDLYSSSPNTTVLWGNTPLSFSGYQLASTKDGCSISDTVDFVNPAAGDLHLLNTAHNQMLTGLGNQAVTNDFDGDPRNPFPAMGADELTFSYQGVSIVGTGSFCKGDSATLIASLGSGIQWYKNGVAITGATTDTLKVFQAGTYYAVLPKGCLTDTSNLISVGVKPINDSVVLSGFTLTSLQPSANWQWMDCNTKLLIPGATGQTFTPTKNGNFAVIISYNGCVDTSNCIKVVGLSVPSTHSSSYSVYPNPFDEGFTVQGLQKGDRLIVFDNLGKLVFEAKAEKEMQQFAIANLIPGYYLLKIIDEQGRVKGNVPLIKK